MGGVGEYFPFQIVTSDTGQHRFSSQRSLDLGHSVFVPNLFEGTS